LTFEHHLDAVRVEWLPPLVEMTSLDELVADTAQAQALPGLRACPAQTFHTYIRGKIRGVDSSARLASRFLRLALPALSVAYLCGLPYLPLFTFRQLAGRREDAMCPVFTGLCLRLSLQNALFVKSVAVA